MNGFQRALFKPLDYFAKPQFAGDYLSLTRARSLVGTNLLIVLLLFVGIFFISALKSLGEYSHFFVSWLLMPALITNLSIPFILRKKAWLAPCQHITLLITFSAIVIGICISGGPILASNNQLMILQAALSLFLLGIRGGLIWSSFVLLTQLSLYYFSFSGVQFPNIQPQEVATAGAIYNWGLSFFAIISMILLIELSRGQLEIQRHKEHERLRYMATHDSLTTLANRSFFEEALSSAISASKKNDSKVLLLYLDLDKFKPINDEWGHDTGDSVLKVVAGRLKATTRGQDLVARLGGDEFAVLLPNLDNQLSIDQLTASIYERITRPIVLNGKNLNIDCSIGICCYPKDATTSEQLWQFADAAMYIAKKKKARWHIHHPLQEAKASSRH